MTKANILTNEQRIESANKLAASLKSYCGEKSRVWAKGSEVRVYLSRGYAQITDDGAADVAYVGGFAGQNGVALRAMDAGLTPVNSVTALNMEKLTKQHRKS